MVVDNNQLEIIQKKYPFLTYNDKERYFIGYLQVDDDDKYNLKIDISSNISSFPKVFELDDRIPKKADRHINSDYSLCFTTKANELILLKTKIKDLVSFFDLILTPYLLNNSFYEINKYYKYGEYSHHPYFSTYETYCDILNVDNFELISTLLNEVSKGRKIRPNEICYCGSGIKIKKCKNHEIGFRNLKTIPVEKLNADSLIIKELRAYLLMLKSRKVPNNLYS